MLTCLESRQLDNFKKKAKGFKKGLLKVSRVSKEKKVNAAT